MNAIWQAISNWWALVQFSAGNCGVTVKTDSAAPGSLEFRAAALGNSAPRPWWRILLNISGGLEIQNAADESFSTASNVLSLAPQSNINANIDEHGVNLDAGSLTGTIKIRNGDGSAVLAQISTQPDGVGGFILTLSARNRIGKLVPCLMCDPGDDPINPVALWIDGGWHRLRRGIVGGVPNVVIAE